MDVEGAQSSLLSQTVTQKAGEWHIASHTYSMNQTAAT